MKLKRFIGLLWRGRPILLRGDVWIGYVVTPGIGYIIKDAPAVGDIAAGATWLFTCDPARLDGEDTLQLLSLNAEQTALFDDEARGYIADQSRAFFFDRPGTDLDISRDLARRIADTFHEASETLDDLREQLDIPGLFRISRPGSEVIGYGGRSEAEILADRLNRGREFDLYSVDRIRLGEIEEFGLDRLGAPVCLLEDEIRDCHEG